MGTPACMAGGSTWAVQMNTDRWGGGQKFPEGGTFFGVGGGGLVFETQALVNGKGIGEMRGSGRKGCRRGGGIGGKIEEAELAAGKKRSAIKGLRDL